MPPESLAAPLGVAFVAAGSLAVVAAAIQHRRFIATLSSPDLPPGYSGRFSIALALLLGAMGLMLAGYLLVER